MSQVNRIQWSEFPALPDRLGFAGMYAGVSSDAVIAMGGANFPGKYPWEGGQKKWYDDIYVFPAGEKWRLVPEKLPAPAGYGVSVTYGDKIIIAGGCTEKEHLATVFSYEWRNNRLVKEELPSLPHPLAYMTGAILGNSLILIGGSESPISPPTRTVLLLDLDNSSEGWHKLDSWPGPERILPVSGVWNNRLFLMGGETSGVSAFNDKYRHILTDNYSLTIYKTGDTWNAQWQIRSPIPRGVSAGGSLPLLENSKFLIWGGVDAVTAQYRNPATHPGITQSTLFYYPENDTWEYLGKQTAHDSRVTLPVIPYQDGWLYVSGEIKPGVRTPKIIKVRGSQEKR